MQWIYITLEFIVVFKALVLSSLLFQIISEFYSAL